MTVDAPLPPPPAKPDIADEDDTQDVKPADQPAASVPVDSGSRRASSAVQAYRSEGVGLKFSATDKGLIYDVMKRSLTQNSGGEISQAEFDYFLAVCSIRGLNPLLREAHLLKTGDGINVQVGIDGFRSLAEETGQYAGQSAPEYEYSPKSDKDYTITVLAGRDWKVVPWVGRPIYAKVGVYRTGALEPFIGESWIEEDFNGNIDTGMWQRRPHTMLAKVAEARAHRKAFPRSLSGIYAEGELADELPRVVGEGAGGATTAALEAGSAPQEGEEVSEGEFRVPEAPRPPEGGQAGEITKVDPEDSYRSVKISWLDDNEVHRKVEVKLTVPGKGKRTAVLLDELAESAAAAELKVGERLWVDDTKVVERQWGKPEDKKPPIKELHAITAAKVWREGEWLDVSRFGPSEDDEEAAAATPEPAAPAQPTLVELTDGQVVQVVGFITRIEWRDAEPGRRVVVAAVQVDDTFYRCAMEESEAKEQLVDAQGAWLFAVGEKVAIMGAGAGGWLALTAVRASA